MRRLDQMKLRGLKRTSHLSSFHTPNSWPERMDSAFGQGLDPFPEDYFTH